MNKSENKLQCLINESTRQLDISLMTRDIHLNGDTKLTFQHNVFNWTMCVNYSIETLIDSPIEKLTRELIQNICHEYMKALRKEDE